MSLSDLLVAFVRTGALLGVALVVALFARGNAPLRVAACRWGLAGALGLALFGGGLSERALPPVAVPAALPSFAIRTPERRVALGEGLSPSRTRRSFEAPVAASSVSLDVLPLVWAAGVFLLAGHLLMGFLLLARVRRGCRPVADAGLTARVTALAREAGVATPFVVEGSAVGGPFVAGVRRATVFLPLGWASATEPETVDAVLRHEIAHVANGDLRWGLFGRFARILLWPQPLVWLLRALQGAAEEAACDRQVLLSGVPKARYAAGLLALREGRGAERTPGLAIGAASRRSGFGRRIEAILSASSVGGARLSRGAGLAIRAGALVLALGAGWTFARPVKATAQAPDPQKGWLKGPYAGTIHMVDDAGKPVQGARAWLSVRDESGVTARELTVKRDRIVLPESKAGADSRGVLAVRVPGYALTPIHLWPVPKPVTAIRLLKPSVLVGTLLLPDGRPAAGVTVEVSRIATNFKAVLQGVLIETAGVAGLAPRSVTDAAGRFRLDGLPPESYVPFDIVDMAYARMRIDEQGTTGLARSTVTTKAVRLKRAARIAGRVTRNGRSVAGVKIGAQSQNDQTFIGGNVWGEAITDADGRYAILRLGPSTVNVAADLSETLGSEVTARAHEGVRVAEGETVTGMDFELVPGTIVEGTVTLPDGKPLVGTPVGIYGPAHPDTSAWVGMARTDARGRYRARVPAGAQRVYLMDSRYETAERRVTTASNAATRVDFQAKVKAEALKAPAEVAAEDVAPREPVEDSPTGPTAAFGPGAPFYGPIRLKGGVTARLAFVQDGDVSGSVWSPDGSPASAKDRARALDWGTGDSRDPKGKSRRLLLRVDVTGLKRGEFDATVEVPHPSSWNVYQSYGGRNDQTIDLATFRANKNLRRTDMRFGIGYGPWRTLAQGRIGEGSLAARVGSKSRNQVTIRFPNAAVFQNSRLVAFHPDRREIPLRRIPGRSSTSGRGCGRRCTNSRGRRSPASSCRCAIGSGSRSGESRSTLGADRGVRATLAGGLSSLSAYAHRLRFDDRPGLDVRLRAGGGGGVARPGEDPRGGGVARGVPGGVHRGLLHDDLSAPDDGDEYGGGGPAGEVAVLPNGSDVRRSGRVRGASGGQAGAHPGLRVGLRRNDRDGEPQGGDADAGVRGDLDRGRADRAVVAASDALAGRDVEGSERAR